LRLTRIEQERKQPVNRFGLPLAAPARTHPAAGQTA